MSKWRRGEVTMWLRGRGRGCRFGNQTQFPDVLSALRWWKRGHCVIHYYRIMGGWPSRRPQAENAPLTIRSEHVAPRSENTQDKFKNGTALHSVRKTHRCWFHSESVGTGTGGVSSELLATTQVRKRSVPPAWKMEVWHATVFTCKNYGNKWIFLVVG